MRIDLHTLTASIVNAGHVCPLRLRGGHVESVELAADPPFGTVRDYQYRVQSLRLEPAHSRDSALADGTDSETSSRSTSSNPHGDGRSQAPSTTSFRTVAEPA